MSQAQGWPQSLFADPTRRKSSEKADFIGINEHFEKDFQRSWGKCNNLNPGSQSINVVDESQLRAVAGRLARLLQPPCLVALQGDLGAGKTAFVRGFVAALVHGDKAHVSSPTYALANTYPTEPIVHHVDLYRLEPTTDLWDLGLAELMVDEEALVCVEWLGDYVKQIRPARLVQVDLTMDATRGPCFRSVHVTCDAT